MPFNIQWVENVLGDIDFKSLQTPAGQLMLHNQNGVIVQTDWLPSGSVNLPADNELNQYWLNPYKIIKISLLKQGTPFRNKVWSMLCEIPFGETMTYSALAKKTDSSARAVGNACRDNPYALFIPCHRVVSISGMGGYCGQTKGDLMEVKHKLLEFEANHKK
ncbi:MAG: methylated-DNA--[protein]-cysteine S-methyltransferase [Methylobacter sp.]|nr:methylated-DNA--[protein]-cysteine S-methyltransferase [Methylobacter sp.]